MNETYLYPYSAKEARERNELSLWRESHRANIACRDAIEDTIRRSFDGMHLNEDCLAPVLTAYGYRDAHPSTLSGGQKQRLAIACAIFSGRRILILDEPTSGLDGRNMRLIAERLKSEERNGRTILVITHDRELIESCCGNVVEVEKRSP